MRREPSHELDQLGRQLRQVERRLDEAPWAELMLRVFGVDPMVCGRCGLRLDVRAIVRVWDTAKKIIDGLHRALPLPLLPCAEAPRDGPTE